MPESPGPAMIPHVVSLKQAAITRFTFVSTHEVPMEQGSPPCRVIVALPVSYEKSRRRRYPMVLIPEAEALMGSSIEMSRGLAVSREARECIVVALESLSLDAAQIARVVDWCRERFRIECGQLALFVSDASLAAARSLASAGAPVDRWIVALGEGLDTLSLKLQRDSILRGPVVAVTTRTAPAAAAMAEHQRAGIVLKVMPEATREGLMIPALIHGLRSFWGTTHAYGSEVMPLSRPFVSHALCTARPLIRALRGMRATLPSVAEPERYVLRSEMMGRDFEVFVSVPRSFGSGQTRFPTVITLDANSSFSTVSETARRMADAQEIGELIVVGVGVPRREGNLAFGLRRFEELSPPCDAAGFDNGLGRFFEAVFSLFGRDVHTHFGRAPQFHRFLSTELLPRLLKSLPIDPDRLCLIGHSAAGTYAGFSLAQADTPFSHHVLLSPGVAISDTWMLSHEGGLSRALAGAPAFVAIGGGERENRFNQLAGIPLAAEYAQRLTDRCAAALEYHCLEGETHTTVFPRAIAQALHSLFGIRTDLIKLQSLENAT